MSEKERYQKVYKFKHIDFGNRLTSVVLFDNRISIGGRILQGLYYDSSGYERFTPRHVLITEDAFLNSWEEVTDENE